MVPVTHFVDPAAAAAAAAAQILLDSFALTYSFPKWTQGGAFKVNLCTKRVTLMSVLLWSHFSLFFVLNCCAFLNLISHRLMLLVKGNFTFNFTVTFISLSHAPRFLYSCFVLVYVAFQKSKKILNKTQKSPIFLPSVIT